MGDPLAVERNRVEPADGVGYGQLDAVLRGKPQLAAYVYLARLVTEIASWTGT